ncbi:MAG: aldose 1-epimerase family protein [Planctomycetaceae bacterium]|nr:aldose 1-epimerase family protein [Planctomycetaceae bacterium]
MRCLVFVICIPSLIISCSLASAQENNQPATEPEYWRYPLIDAESNFNLAEFSLSSKDLPEAGDQKWSLTMSTLAGGKQDGVRLISYASESLSFSLLPTRGMSIYEVRSGDLRLGWDSPVKEHVHPKYINLDSRGGLGWLEGFNEWMVRCGLEFAGHPGLDEFVTNTGEVGQMDLTLHGKIGNIPASQVEVLVEKQPPHRVHIRGVVHERLFFGPKLKLTADLSTVPGEYTLRVRDEVENLGASPQEMQLIYHTNYGANLLEKGAKVIAPGNMISPMNDHAAQAIETWDTYQEPTPGFIEEVFLIHPYANAEGQTGVLLQNANADRGASIHWNIKELPYLTVWKNTVAEADGYVTGLEPATGFPYNRQVEREAGRVPILEPGASRTFTLNYRLHTDAESVQQATQKINAYQGARPTEVLDNPLTR